MKFIEIAPLENGAHENAEFEGTVFDIPDSETWAVISEEVVVPDSFPFVDIITEKQVFEANGETKEFNVVISMTRKERINTELKAQPSVIDDMMAMIVDQEYRLTLLEAKG